MKKRKQNQLSRCVVAALILGLFSMTTVAYALPTGGTSTSATITNTSATQMDIAGSKANNVINWQSFSIANGETVAFDANNYLNLVRGTSKSEINGILNGTGNIYLINPNGILFGSTARVNVGNLVASTRAITNVYNTGL